MTAGAPPPAVFRYASSEYRRDPRIRLTKTYGPVTLCAWRDDLWGSLDAATQAQLKARQGVNAPMLEAYGG